MKAICEVEKGERGRAKSSKGGCGRVGFNLIEIF